MGFLSMGERLRAHGDGTSALVEQDWALLVDISRTAWSTFLQDVDAIAAWVDGMVL